MISSLAVDICVGELDLGDTVIWIALGSTAKTFKSCDMLRSVKVYLTNSNGSDRVVDGIVNYEMWGQGDRQEPLGSPRLANKI